MKEFIEKLMIGLFLIKAYYDSLLFILFRFAGEYLIILKV